MATPKNHQRRPFTLEVDDQTDEERAQSKEQGTKDHWTSAFGVGASKKERIPMDSEYQEELGEPSSQIKINRNFVKGVRGITGEAAQDKGKFDMRRLFSAVSSGEVAQLEGLEQYLRRAMKHLTDSEYRSKGKTALLKALLNLTDGRNDTVKLLLDIAEKMGDLKEFVNAAYTDIYYKGQTALHVAIERRSQYFVELLVQKGADVHAKACGKFFQLHDGPCFYFGELPLSLAACTNQKDMVDFLLENQYQNTDVREADSQGNIVLHALVMVADNSPENTDFIIKMYDHILTRAAQLHPKVKLEEIENKQGLTPIKLAAKKGKIELFKHILHREFQDKKTRHLSRKFTEWAYGPVYSSLYDLSSLDSYETKSVLEIVVYGTEIPNRLEMLQVEPLSQLLEEKWRRFAHPIFLFTFVVYLIYLSVFTTVAYFRKDGSDGLPPYPLENTLEDYFLASGQIILLLGSLYFFFKGLSDLKRKRPTLETLLVDGFCELIFFTQAVLFLVSVVFYFCSRKEYLGFMVLCLALSWVNVLYYSRGSKNMGIYGVMIQKMILGDILRFLFVYMVFLFGFSAAIVVLLDEPEPNSTTNVSKARFFFTTDDSTNCKKPTFKNFYFTTLELFKFTIGMGDLEFTEQYRYKEVFYVLLISYIVLTYILLLNMLIALMNKTVEKTSKESTNIWRLQRAITILDIERRLPRCLKRRLRSGVEKNLGNGNGEDRRWCFRVEEVNWIKWNTCLGIIHEDPGNQDFRISTPPPGRPGRERSWRGFLRDFSQRRPHEGQQHAQEMNLLSVCHA
ncbi:transient receptor potential cation channel subfamily V member 1 [Alosa alosa]|uniref:transient receptor potential cation channel subfamily V member 1 n=1 Tax=Alosa alosa TaxID=278164 RepID=UPI0020154894|nr:transient receptor potential cation channel subfamily V member 1 [Alosa alosa]